MKVLMRAACAGAIGLSVFISGPACAFKAGGHKLIEQEAYEELPKETLQALIDGGILQKGEHGYPEVRNHNADFALERQFDQGLQCYHFMASNAAVREAARAKNSEATLLELALPPCLKLMRSLFMESTRHAWSLSQEGAHQAGRGMYVLIHILVDSYSQEHARRDDEMRLRTVKGWELSRLKWGSYPAATQGVGTACTGHEQLMQLLHTRAGAADYDFCGKCAESRGLVAAAMQAVADLLRAAHQAAPGRGRWSEPEAQRVWAHFVAKHLQPAGYVLEADAFKSASGDGRIKINESATLAEQDSYPWLTIAGVHVADGSGASASGLEVQWDLVPWTAAHWYTRVAPNFSFQALRMDQPASGNGDKISARIGTSFDLPTSASGAELRPQIGMGYEIDGQKSVVGRIDLAWSPHDFGDWSLRLGFGWQYDSKGTPARHAVVAFIGVNSWASRVVDDWSRSPSEEFE